MLKIYDATIEHLKDPMCIDNPQPRFSWKLISDKLGVVQTEYHITVKCGSEVRWDSGRVFSDQSCNVIYNGLPLKSREQLMWSVCVKARDENGGEEETHSEWFTFEMGLLEKDDWKAQWIEPENDVDINARKPALYLRKCFKVKEDLSSAKIYQTAHGLYEFQINGEEGTPDRFKPGLTSYYHRIQYQMYDITALLKEGQNCWSVVLGDGWWRGVTGGTLKNNFGYKLGYFGQIELIYSNGEKEIIPTDDSFLHSTGGLLASDMLMGDIFDARKEPIGWKLPEFDDSSWQKVHTVKDEKNAKLIASASVPVREKERFAPILLKDSEGRDVLDFGQNIAGYVKMRLRDCKEGQKITLVHGEGLKEGAFSIENINKCSCPVEAFQQVEYICRGEAVEEYCPCFAVFGFRYVCVEGYENISPEDFEAIAVYSDMPEVGDFTCSDELINKLVKNSRWSQKGNFLDVAVDCPTRERNAWTGDAQVYVRTAANFMDTYSFYEKWLQDQAIEQYASGKVGITFPSTSSTHQPEELEKALKNNKHAALAGPTGNGNIGEDAVGWGDSAVWLPYITYLCYGDPRILENQYETSRKWVDFMLSCAKEHNPKYEKQPQYKKRGEDGILDGEFIYDTRFQYGEWNEPIKRSAIENAIFMAKIVKAKGDFLSALAAEGRPEVATAYMYRSACNVAQMAKTLGKAQDAEKYSKLAERIKGVYQKYFIKKNGTIEKGHQAPYVRALTFGLCSEGQKPKVLDKLIKEIKKANYHLNTGFLSTPFLLPVLVETGNTDTAYKILEQKSLPGWLHTVEMGATTIPEGWNGFDDFAGSFNHYSYGAVCEFLFAYTAGIRPIWENPGYSEFILKPVPGGSLTKAKAEFESPFGKIISEWEKKENGYEYHCEIPANTKAVLTLPNCEEHLLGSGSYDFTF